MPALLLPQAGGDEKGRPDLKSACGFTEEDMIRWHVELYRIILGLGEQLHYPPTNILTLETKTFLPMAIFSSRLKSLRHRFSNTLLANSAGDMLLA